MAAALRAGGVTVATGRFGAEMAVELVNDGPFTLVLDSARDLALARAQRHGMPVVEDAACAIGSEIRIGGAWERIGRPHGTLAPIRRASRTRS